MDKARLQESQAAVTSPHPCSHTCHDTLLLSAHNPPKTDTHCQLDGRLRKEKHRVILLLSAWDTGPLASASCFWQGPFPIIPKLPFPPWLTSFH